MACPTCHLPPAPHLSSNTTVHCSSTPAWWATTSASAPLSSLQNWALRFEGI